MENLWQSVTLEKEGSLLVSDPPFSYWDRGKQADLCSLLLVLLLSFACRIKPSFAKINLVNFSPVIIFQKYYECLSFSSNSMFVNPISL